MIKVIQKLNPSAAYGAASSGDDSRQPHIRVAIIEDLPAIVTCLDLSFASFADAEFEDNDDIQLAENLTSQIREGSVHVACDESQVVGYISFWPAGEQMFIDTLAVLPNHRRQGLGSKLLALADYETLQRGLEAVTLFTKARMSGNSRFYQSCGYRETGRCDDDGFCRVFYLKKMAA